MAKGNYSLGAAMMSETPAGTVGKADKKAEKSKIAPGDVQRIEIEVADNGGFSVQCYRKPSASRSKNDIGYEAPKKHVFSSKSELDDYIDEALGTSDASGE